MYYEYLQLFRHCIYCIYDFVGFASGISTNEIKIEFTAVGLCYKGYECNLRHFF
jgi:hypothetical protein